jgi:cohesin loading factor subunit SCC2
MSTDSETRVSHTADRELQEIEKKYPGFIHMKLMQGIRLSYNLQVYFFQDSFLFRFS